MPFPDLQNFADHPGMALSSASPQIIKNIGEKFMGKNNNSHSAPAPTGENTAEIEINLPNTKPEHKKNLDFNQMDTFKGVVTMHTADSKHPNSYIEIDTGSKIVEKPMMPYHLWDLAMYGKGDTEKILQFVEDAAKTLRRPYSGIVKEVHMELNPASLSNLSGAALLHKADTIHPTPYIISYPTQNNQRLRLEYPIDQELYNTLQSKYGPSFTMRDFLTEYRAQIGNAIGRDVSASNVEKKDIAISTEEIQKLCRDCYNNLYGAEQYQRVQQSIQSGYNR